MIIRSKAPLRLGLAGGGSDVSPYSDLYGGQILNATINLSAYCTIETQPGETVRIDAYDCDTHVECPLDAALAPAPDLIRGVYRRVVQDFGPVPGAFRITTYNDAPAGSGLGTSSTMVVCILKCFAEWLNLPLGDYETARLAYEIERKDLALAGGKQDQYAAAFGGFNFMEFHQDDIVIVNPLKIKSWIVDEMHRIRQSSTDMKFALLKGDMAEFGRILGQAWEDKKKMAGAITNPVIQEAFDAAMAAGAVAGKVSGAGGGGFIMLMVPPTRKMAVVRALEGLPGKVVPFQFTERGAHAWRVYDTDKVPEQWKR